MLSKQATHYFDGLSLNEDPFTTSPDPSFFFPLKQHQSCLAHLEISVRLKRGACLVLGEIGTGKTTLCRSLLQNLSDDENIETHLLLNPTSTTEEGLLSTLTQLFKLSGRKKPSVSHADLLKHYLFTMGVDKGKTVLLIVDESQKLNLECIEALRGLLNYETNEFKLLQLILFGQPELKYKLREMPNFVDRLNYKVQLLPLSLEMCKQLIAFRIQKAGAREGEGTFLFTDEAIEVIHAETEGYPRKICLLAHRALERLIMFEKTVIDEALVLEILEEDLDI